MKSTTVASNSFVLLAALALAAGASAENGGRAWSAGASLTGPASIPTETRNLAGAVDLAAGQSFSMARRDDLTVWTWGANTSGQLGNGTYQNSDVPGKVRLNGVVAIAAGGYHALAVRDDGSVWAWGDNTFGQLGDGTNSSSDVPRRVEGLRGIVSVSAGDFHSVALNWYGEVFTWGWNGHGQLGDGSRTTRPRPVQVAALENIVEIRSGANHNLALDSSGAAVWAWGANADGQLGLGHHADTAAPARVGGHTGAALAIAAGGRHSLILVSNGTVYGAGSNAQGQLSAAAMGLSSPELASVPGLRATAIAAGRNHSLARVSTGAVWAWGANGSGQLGDGSYLLRQTPSPMLYVESARAIAAGGNQSLAAESRRATVAASR